MNKILSWLSAKNTLNSNSYESRERSIKSSILLKNVKQFDSHVRTKLDRVLCLETFLEHLSVLSDEDYVLKLVSLLSRSKLTCVEYSKAVSDHTRRLLTKNKFDEFERILRLPLPSFSIILSTNNLMKLLHECHNIDQVTHCLSLLHQRNIKMDSNYSFWILFTILQEYSPGDEQFIEFLFKTLSNPTILFTSNPNTEVTPFMFLIRLCTYEQCFPLIEHYISKIEDSSLLNRADKWNRSYLTHLLSGQCQHENVDNNQNDEQEINVPCPNASSVLKIFCQLFSLNARCDLIIKTIIQSNFCMSLRISLFNFVLKHDSSSSRIDHYVNEFVRHFPSNLFPKYSLYFKGLTNGRNLNEALVQSLVNIDVDLNLWYKKIEFLLENGATIQHVDAISATIEKLLITTRSRIPFLLLNHRYYYIISFSITQTSRNNMVDLYIRQLIEWGYDKGWKTNFQQLKSQLLPDTIQYVENYVKNVPKLSTLCIRHTRSFLVNMSNDNREKLKNYLPKMLSDSLVDFAYKQHSHFLNEIMKI